MIRRHRWKIVGFVLVICLGLGALHGWAVYRFRTAQEAVQADKPDDARPHIQFCVRIWPFSVETHLLAARIERLAGDYKRAEDYLEECKRLQGESNDAIQLEWLLLRAQNGEMDKLSAGLWRLVDDKHPESPMILRTMAKAYLRDFRLHPARFALDRWLELEPNNARALTYRGYTLEKLQFPKKAVADFEKALQIDPTALEVRVHLATILLDEQSSAELIRPHIDYLQEHFPDDPEVKIKRARFLALEGKLLEARKLFSEIIASKPSNVGEPLHQWGRMELETSNAKRAEELLRRAFEEAPWNGEALYALYQSVSQQGRDEEAKELLEQHKAHVAKLDRLMDLINNKVGTNPNNMDYRWEVGKTFLELGKADTGLEWLYQVLNRDPRHIETHRTLAAHFEGKDNVKATQHREALETLEKDKP